MSIQSGVQPDICNSTTVNEFGAPRFRFLIDGAEIIGCVQGCGGLVTSLARLESAKRIAAQGRAHGLYEPAAGCVSVFTEYSAASNGPATIVPVSSLVGGA